MIMIRNFIIVLVTLFASSVLAKESCFMMGSGSHTRCSIRSTTDKVRIRVNYPMQVICAIEIKTIPQMSLSELPQNLNAKLDNTPLNVHLTLEPTFENGKLLYALAGETIESELTLSTKSGVGLSRLYEEVVGIEATNAIYAEAVTCR